MTDPPHPDDLEPAEAGPSRPGSSDGSGPEAASDHDAGDDGTSSGDPAGAGEAGEAGTDTSDAGGADRSDHLEPAEGEEGRGRTKLTREQAREQAEAEKAEREAQVLRDALELARADAQRMLAGPGLVTPDPPMAVDDLESTWSARALEAAEQVRRDLASHRVGLAISGGGSLGSFEAGVLRFLYDHIGIDPVAICGNSAGALNAAKLAEGPHSDRRPIDEVERIWRSLRINSDMWEPEPWLVRLQASASWAAALREQVSDSDSAASAVKVAVRVVGSLVRRPPETDGTIDAVKEAIRAQSLLSLAPVADLVARELDPERVRASGIALRMGTVSLEAGELRYVTETGALHDRHDRPVDDQAAVPLASGVLASASIPMAFPPVEMNGEHYVDGGAREILPLELLVTRMGVERVIAVSASSASIKRAPSFADRNLLDILRRVSAEIAPNETLRKELNPPGGWDPAVRLVVPQFDVHDSMTIDPALIAISLDHGYLRAADVLLSLGPEAESLTEQVTRLRIRLRHLAGPVPTIFDTTLGRARRRLEARDIETTAAEDVGTGDAPDDVAPAEPEEETEAEARPRRSIAVTRMAKLVKVIGRESAEAPESEDRPAELTVELSVDEAGDPSEVEVIESDEGVELVITPPAATGSPTARGAHPLDGDVEGDGDDDDDPASEPDAELDAETDADAVERERAAEVEAVTAELKELVLRRLEIGAPLPQTLLAWLREPETT